MRQRWGVGPRPRTPLIHIYTPFVLLFFIQQKTVFYGYHLIMGDFTNPSSLLVLVLALACTARAYLGRLFSILPRTAAYELLAWRRMRHSCVAISSTSTDSAAGFFTQTQTQTQTTQHNRETCLVRALEVNGNVMGDEKAFWYRETYQWNPGRQETRKQHTKSQ